MLVGVSDVFTHPHSTGKVPPLFLEICSHYTELKKEVTGRNKATVQKQLYIAEVGILQEKWKCLLYV